MPTSENRSDKVAWIIRDSFQKGFIEKFNVLNTITNRHEIQLKFGMTKLKIKNWKSFLGWTFFYIQNLNIKFLFCMRIEKVFRFTYLYRK